MNKRTYTYKTADGCEIKADVYRARGEAPLPTIMWIHGGALMFCDRTDLSEAQCQAYLDAGYNVVAIDYRLAPETKLDGIIEDLHDAYAWLRTQGHQFGIDPERIAVIGHSAGGYLALMAGMDLRPRAVVAFYGYGDIDGDWYGEPYRLYREQFPLVTRAQAEAVVGKWAISSGPIPPFPGGRSAYYLYCRQQGLWPLMVTGHDPRTELRAFDRFCPVRNVAQDHPPTLLLHGDRDIDVPYEQSRGMAAAFAKQGVPHRLITMVGLGHGFDAALASDPTVAAAFADVLAFLRKHV